VRGPGHDKAFRDAVEETKRNFKQCPKCSHWVCLTVCWKDKRGLCHDCAPNVETELSAAQAQATVEQLRSKVQSADMTPYTPRWKPGKVNWKGWSKNSVRRHKAFVFETSDVGRRTSDTFP
jgi:hypothetical protein